MRFSRIVACGLALIGGYFLVLRLAWLVHVDEPWLPYVAHGAGALIAGAVIERQGGARRSAAAVGAIAGVAILAVISVLSPRTFGWVALRADLPWLVGIAIAVGCALLAGLGAYAAEDRGPGGGLGSVMILSTTVAACAIYLGSRIVFALLGRHDGAVAVIASICALSAAAAFLVQWVVPRVRVVGCASGTAILMMWELVEAVRRPYGGVSAELLIVLLPIVAALAGSYLASRVKPAAPADRTLDAFD